MNEVFWLLIGNVIFWGCLGGYCLFIGHCQKRIDKNLKQLEILRDDKV